LSLQILPDLGSQGEAEIPLALYLFPLKGASPMGDAYQDGKKN